MVDLGIFNFIKNALAQGQSKESIEASLLAQGMTKEDISSAFGSVESGIAPIANSSYAIPSVVGSPVSQTISGFEQWYSFRNAFWRYFSIAFIVSAVSVVLKIGVIYILVIFVLLFLIAGQIGKVTSEIQGKKSWSLMILGFFLPPAAFYFVYRMAKQQGWNISLSIVEGVIVAIGMVLYVLWGLAVGGIVAAILLASQTRPQTPTVNQPTALGPSSNKNAVLSETQAEFRSMVVFAELYRTHSADNTYGISTDCYSGGMFTDPKIVQSIKNIAAYTEFSPTCGSNGKQYAIQQKVKDLAYVCIDSTGKNEITSTPISNNTVVCP